MSKQWCNCCGTVTLSLSEDGNCEVCESQIEEWVKEEYNRYEREQEYLRWMEQNNE